VVAKNTLTKLAAKEAGLEGVDDLLKGPTGIVFAEGDPIAGAKAFMEVARRFPALQIKGAFVEGHVFDEEGAKGLATVESREISMAKIAGLLQSPLSRIAYLLQAPVQRIAYALAERGKQGGDASAPDTEPTEAAAAPAQEAPETEASAPVPEASETEASAPETGSIDAPPAPEPVASAPEADAPEADAAPTTETGSG
jgi:large subunit ribosomal protein L10